MGSAPMLPRGGRILVTAHTLAAALALASTWRPGPGGHLHACSAAAGLAHVAVSRRDRWGYLMGDQLPRSKRSAPSTISRDATTGAPGAALPGREMAASTTVDAGAGLRSEFLDVLLSRRRDLQVPLSVEKGTPVKKPMYQKPVRPNEILFSGMHAWFTAFVDTRYSVTVPIIGVQGFQWAVDNNKWQARVDSIKPLFEVLLSLLEARIDLGKSEIDTEVVEKVWEKIAPALNSQFDAPYSLPLIAPRPLLLLNGAEDGRCPIAGLEEPSSRAAKAYEESGSAEKFMAKL
nr:unnamed protein product [Digitaria exilis]